MYRSLAATRKRECHVHRLRNMEWRCIWGNKFRVYEMCEGGGIENGKQRDPGCYPEGGGEP